MSRSNLRPTRYLASILQNGIGRYVCQLQRLTFQFHKTSLGSHGVREFVEQDIVNFAEKNPQIVLYVTPHEKYREPKLVAEFLNGNVTKVPLLNKVREDVVKDVELLRAQSGQEIIKIRKWWHTDNPSIQGMWQPFTNKPTNLNLVEFPMEAPRLQVKSRPFRFSKEDLKQLREAFKNDDNIKTGQCTSEGSQ